MTFIRIKKYYVNLRNLFYFYSKTKTIFCYFVILTRSQSSDLFAIHVQVYTKTKEILLATQIKGISADFHTAHLFLKVEGVCPTSINAFFGEWPGTHPE